VRAAKYPKEDFNTVCVAKATWSGYNKRFGHCRTVAASTVTPCGHLAELNVLFGLVV
jgi:hypothetical protein